MGQVWAKVARQMDRVYIHMNKSFPKSGHVNIGIPVEDAKKLVALLQAMIAADCGEARISIDDGGLGGEFEKE